jgi:signal transduction histidine kinase
MAAADPPRSEVARSRWARHATVSNGFWLVRAAALVLIAILTLARPGSAGHRAWEVGILVVIAALMVVWGWEDNQSGPRRAWDVLSWPLVVTLSGLGVLGGLGAALSPVRSMAAFAAMAALAAGSDLPAGPACAVAAVGAVGVETGGLIFGDSTSTAVGLPLVLVVCLLAGRTRREARLRVNRAVATVSQMRQTHSEQQRVVALDERQRIAREIHDVLAHSLSALGLQIEAAQAVLNESGDIATASRLLGHAHHLANEGLDETRRAIHALRADAPPLPESLAAMVGSHWEHHRQRIDLTVTGDARPLPPDANVALVRASQEALTNAAKHAPDSLVTVELAYGPEVTILTVTNAVAASPSTTLGGGYGLAGMRERLLLIDGTLTAGAADGCWTVEARVPR